MLNYALTLEYLEAAFYETALDNISESDLVDDGPLAEFGDPVTDSAYENLETIRDHEQTHVDTLVSVIESLDGDPVDEPEFDFGSAVEEPEEFIATAVQLEDTGVSAYAGAAPFIEGDSLVPPALSIHSVEARHAAFLRVLDEQIPFPEAFDDPRSRSEVLDIASAFIVD
ncbi:ferritin-like domain-containing protein [Halomicroarcula sp. GCM10025894]|uniref:ferritin-like domain-containing protein n=1 Tax=Halomicroarcula sp. GCM10025894 TaxID=3252673 RepID=UPI00361AF4F0